MFPGFFFAITSIGSLKKQEVKMKKILYAVPIILIVLLIVVYQMLPKPIHRAFDAAADTERVTASGKVVGYVENNGSHAWLGIPYAQPPEGTLRWKAPQPAEKWEGTLNAVEESPVCTQYGHVFTDTSLLSFNKPTGQEDCLYLNIHAPAFTSDQVPGGNGLLPVMVWIHGGGNSVGHGAVYNGKVIAKNHQLIVVTINYRLGPMGWFTHPALRETGATPEDRSGNYGTLDIIQALKWVRNNITAFGGDPGKVTIFGESAGAFNSLSMLISPMAGGLFHGAIIESGGLSTLYFSKAENYSDAAEKGHQFSSREVINRLLIADGTVANRNEAKAHQEKMSHSEIADYLYSKSSQELLNAYKPGSAGMISFPQMFRDGSVIPDADPLILFSDKAGYNAVPVIIGTNRDENKIFMSLDPEYVSFRGPRDPIYYDLIAAYQSNVWKANGVDEIARAITRGNGLAYAYRFDWDEEPSLLGINMSKLVGAGHGLEIAFAFNNFENLIMGFNYYYGKDNDPGRNALADSISSYWAEFAYTGSPGKGRGGKEIEWTGWNNDPKGDKFIIFDTQADQGIRMSGNAVYLKDLKAQILAEKRFRTQKVHCNIYATAFSHTPLWDQKEYDNLGEEGCREFPKEMFEW